MQRGEQIWLRIAFLLGPRKYWEQILGTVGPLFFSFSPKTDYLRNLLGTLGDALRDRFTLIKNEGWKSHFCNT